MQTTPKLGLKKPDLNDYVNVADLNDNADILDAAVSVLQDGTAIITNLETANKTLAGGINENKNNLATHLAESMPHQFTEGGKTYRWGFRIFEGKPQFIHEEVI